MPCGLVPPSVPRLAVPVRPSSWCRRAKAAIELIAKVPDTSSHCNIGINMVTDFISSPVFCFHECHISAEKKVKGAFSLNCILPLSCCFLDCGAALHACSPYFAPTQPLSDSDGRETNHDLSSGGGRNRGSRFRVTQPGCYSFWASCSSV